MQHIQAAQLISLQSSSQVLYVGHYEGVIPGHPVCNTAGGPRHLIALKVFDSHVSSAGTSNLPWEECNSELAILHRIAHIASQHQQFTSAPVSSAVRVLGLTSVQGRPALVMERALSDARGSQLFTTNHMLCPSPGWRGWPEASDWWECCQRPRSSHYGTCPSGLHLWALRVIAHDVLRALLVVHAAQARSASPDI